MLKVLGEGFGETLLSRRVSPIRHEQDQEIRRRIHAVGT
jgi:hypothetical protein